MQNAPPEIFLLANTEKIAVSEIDIEDYGDAEGQADQRQGGHQQLPHLRREEDPSKSM